MTLEELNEIIKDSEYKEWFETCKLELYFNVADTKKELVGFLNIYNFFEEQLMLWNESSASDVEPIKASMNWVQESFEELQEILKKLPEGSLSKYDLKHTLDDIKNSYSFDSKYFYLPEFNETTFLNELASLSKEHALGAHEYFSGRINSNERNRDKIEGRLLAYEMRTKDLAHLVDRKERDRRSFSKLQADYKAFLKKLEKSHEDVANEKRAINEKYQKEFDESKTSINERLKILEKQYKDDSEWAIRESKGRFDEIEQSFEKLKEDTDQQFQDHGKAYAELLMLKEPAEYWQKRAEKLNASGKKWLRLLIAVSLAGVLVLFLLGLSLTSDRILEHIKNPAVSIRWSLFSLFIIGLIAYLIRISTRLMMSNFHLYRDAEERKQLTYLYLSLINEADISDADRNVVLQALFSRADTGLLKDDSSPSMPAIHLDKLNS